MFTIQRNSLIGIVAIGIAILCSVLIMTTESVHAQHCTRPDIERGSTGTHVIHAQNQLLKVGGEVANHVSSTGGADGDYGNGTYNAVLTYQQLVFPNNSAEWTGKIKSSTWSKLGCNSTTTPASGPSRLSTPTMYTPTFNEVNENLRYVTADWSSVSGTREYHVRYTHDGDVFLNTAVTASSERINIGSRTGQICVTVVATDPGRDSNRSASRCVTAPASPQPPPPLSQLPTPRLTTATYNQSNQTVTFGWLGVSGTREYHLRLTHDGDAFQYPAEPSSATRGTYSIGSIHGRICATIVATDPGRDSNRSAEKCVDVAAPPLPRLDTPTMYTPRFSRNTLKLTLNWSPITDTNQYHIRLLKDGVPFQHFATNHPTTELVTSVEATGYLCAQVIATLSGRDSHWSREKCFVAELPAGSTEELLQRIHNTFSSYTYGRLWDHSDAEELWMDASEAHLATYPALMRDIHIRLGGLTGNGYWDHLDVRRYFIEAESLANSQSWVPGSDWYMGCARAKAYQYRESGTTGLTLCTPDDRYDRAVQMWEDLGDAYGVNTDWLELLDYLPSSQHYEGCFFNALSYAESGKLQLHSFANRPDETSNVATAIWCFEEDDAPGMEAAVSQSLSYVYGHSETQIVDHFDYRYGDNPNISGLFILHTNYEPCSDCQNVLSDFNRKFPNMISICTFTFEYPEQKTEYREFDHTQNSMPSVRPCNYALDG